MAPLANPQKSSQIEVEIDKKAQKEGEKMMRSQWDQSDVYNNFATPLPGTFINLPKESCLLQCPSCGIKDMTKVETELHRSDWAAIILSRLFYCCVCCCCTKEEFCRPIFQMMPNHYCNNCGCYFGQHSRIHKVKVQSKK